MNEQQKNLARLRLARHRNLKAGNAQAYAQMMRLAQPDVPIDRSNLPGTPEPRLRRRMRTLRRKLLKPRGRGRKR